MIPLLATFAGAMVYGAVYCIAHGELACAAGLVLAFILAAYSLNR